MPELLSPPGITPEQLLANFRAFQNNPSATLDDMYAYQNAQQQRARVSVPLTAGKGTWTFARAFPVGVVPVVQVTVETPDVANYTLDAKIVANSVDNTKADIQVNRINASGIIGVLNSLLQIFLPATGTVMVNCYAGTATA